MKRLVKKIFNKIIKCQLFKKETIKPIKARIEPNRTIDPPNWTKPNRFKPLSHDLVQTKPLPIAKRYIGIAWSSSTTTSMFS